MSYEMVHAFPLIFENNIKTPFVMYSYSTRSCDNQRVKILLGTGVAVTFDMIPYWVISRRGNTIHIHECQVNFGLPLVDLQ